MNSPPRTFNDCNTTTSTNATRPIGGLFTTMIMRSPAMSSFRLPGLDGLPTNLDHDHIIDHTAGAARPSTQQENERVLAILDEAIKIIRSGNDDLFSSSSISFESTTNTTSSQHPADPRQ
ncbi:unnamed protein product [Cylindrotheca closterium]|uniref:Uncharacterized protein n=1 Tax=Cylindrotheca closterium TaxID=2856 RepID=A0AAD2FYL3_9STRA|nr:unnamed protein product [Cylindrotheca closterium]